jgi:cytochrome o ubiquinol oxidase subunit 2
MATANVYVARTEVDQESRMTFESHNPATGELVGTYPEHDEAETNVLGCHFSLSYRPWFILVMAALSGCDRGILDPVGPVGAAERKILFDSLAIMLAIVIPVIIATLLIAFRFRASNTRAQYWPTFTHSGRIELITWSIPALVIFFLGGLAWTSSFLLDPSRPLASRTKPLEIQVVSLDWKWLFIYPEQRVASINRLVVPAGVPLRLRLTSASVWNAFWVPQLGGTLYCMYGMAGTLYLQADHPGVYPGGSAMISGDGFADMHFDTDAMSNGDFTSWVSAAQAAGPELDDGAYRALLRQSSNVPPQTYRSVRPGLFEAIVTQQLPPGEGPQQAVLNPSVVERPR